MGHSVLQDDQDSKRAFDAVPVMMWTAVAEGRCTFVNKAWLQYSGRSLEEELEMGWTELVHPDDLDRFLESYNAAYRERREYTVEHRLRGADGQYRCFVNAGHPKFTPTGELAGFIGTCINITESKRAEALLIASEARYRDLYDNAPDMFVSVEPSKGMIVDCNSTLAEATGYTKDEIIGRHISEMYHPDSEAARQIVFDNFLEMGEVHDAELQLRRKDGTKIDVSLNLSSVRDGEDRVLYSRSIWRDITARKSTDRKLMGSRDELENRVKERTEELSKANDALLHVIAERTRAETEARRSAQELSDFFEEAPISIHCVGPDGIILKANQAELELLGYGHDEYVGHPINEFHADQPVIDDILNRLSAGETLVNYRARLLRKDKSIKDVLINSDVVWEEDRFVHTRCFTRDITKRLQADRERRQLEAQVQHAQKLESLGVLAGGIAHDFNNLLVGILGNADLALADLPPGSPGTRELGDITQAAERAADLCKQMLAYSGRGQFVIKPLHLSETIEQMAWLLDVSISKNVAFTTEFEPDLPPIEGDVTQIRQIIMNLITNASDAIGEQDGVIKVSTGLEHYVPDERSGPLRPEALSEGDYVFLRIEDTGCGMDERTKERLFDPFFTTKFTGRGLGLSAVLGIVKGHGGAIEVQSEPGKGTVLKVRFPVSQRPVETAPSSSPSMEVQATGTVLVVDDEEMVRNLAKDMLEHAGFSVLTASDGLEGVETLRRRGDEISVVLLDLTMPKLSGDAALSRMGQIKPDVPVVLCSGYDEQDASRNVAGGNFAGFVQKPYRYEKLISTLSDALGR